MTSPERSNSSTGQPAQDVAPAGAAPPRDALDSPAPAGKWRWIRRILYLLLTACVLYFVGRELASRIVEIDWGRLRLNGWLLALGVGCMVLHEALCGVTLHLTLKAFGYGIGVGRPIVAYWTSALGRYLPGKVATLAGVVALLRRFGVRMSVGVGATVLHTALTMLIGLMISAPLVLGLPFLTSRDWGSLAGAAGRTDLTRGLWCLLIVAAGLVCLHPRVFIPLSNVVLRRTGRAPITSRTHNRYLLAAVVLIPLRFCVLGLGVWLTARSLRPLVDVSAAQMPLVAATAVAATVIGFLAFFVPAGLGVREGIYVVMLSGAVGAGPAALLALLVRLCQTVVDVGVGASGTIMLRRWASAPQ